MSTPPRERGRELERRIRRDKFGEAIYRRFLSEDRIAEHLEQHPEDLNATATGIKVGCYMALLS